MINTFILPLKINAGGEVKSPRETVFVCHGNIFRIVGDCLIYNKAEACFSDFIEADLLKFINNGELGKVVSEKHEIPTVSTCDPQTSSTFSCSG